MSLNTEDVLPASCRLVLLSILQSPAQPRSTIPSRGAVAKGTGFHGPVGQWLTGLGGGPCSREGVHITRPSSFACLRPVVVSTSCVCPLVGSTSCLCPLVVSTSFVRWLCPRLLSAVCVHIMCFFAGCVHIMCLSAGCVHVLCPLVVSTSFVRWLCPRHLSAVCVHVMCLSTRCLDGKLNCTTNALKHPISKTFRRKKHKKRKTEEQAEEEGKRTDKEQEEGRGRN